MKRSAMWLMSLTVLFTIGIANLEGAEGKAKAAKAAAAKADKPAARKTANARNKKTSTRLPPYYSEVIDEVDREKFAGLYAKYSGKLAKLKEEVKTLTAERDAALEELLSAEQKAKLAKLKEDAKAKRARTAAK